MAIMPKVQGMPQQFLYSRQSVLLSRQLDLAEPPTIPFIPGSWPRPQFFFKVTVQGRDAAELLCGAEVQYSEPRIRKERLVGDVGVAPRPQPPRNAGAERVGPYKEKEAREAQRIF